MAETTNASHPYQGTGAAADPRLALALRIEWTMLAGRYLAVVLTALLFLVSEGPLPGGPLLYALCAYFLLHNLGVHWVLATRYYALFFSSLNFLLYIGEVTLLVAMAGPSDSPFFVLYLLFIIAFNTYSRLSGGALVVTLLCCFSYALVVYAEWTFGTVAVTPGTIAAKFLSLVMGGWLVGSLNEFLKETEAALESRAAALASSEATLRMILDSTDDPILTYDENEFVTDANDKACEFLGCSRDELIGSRIRTHLFDDGTLSGQFAAMRSRGEYHGESLVLRSNGSECNVAMHVHSFLQADQRYFVSIWHDLTDVKRMRESSRVARLQLEEVNRELYHVKQLKTAFFTNISRRLHSPLSAILGFLDMMRNEELGPVTPEQSQALQSCRRSVERIVGLVDEVFDLESEKEALPVAAPGDTLRDDGDG